MAEHNTDRLYWVMGSVLVGAILIGIAAWIFRDVLKEKIHGIYDSLFNKASNRANQIDDGKDPFGGN